MTKNLLDRPHILVVDDDARLRELLRRYLCDNGFLVSVAEHAAAARRHMQSLVFDLIVLDVMMPGETGIELANYLRGRRPAVPILLLTAMGEPQQRIDGLETGADDYLVKPFEPRELVLRIQSILRRGGGQTADKGKISFGPFVFDILRAQLVRSGEPVYLTATETAQLRRLAEAGGAPVSREDLARLAAENGTPMANERSVDVQIMRLRKKIETMPSRPVYIQTVRSAGYVLKTDIPA